MTLKTVYRLTNLLVKVSDSLKKASLLQIKFASLIPLQNLLGRIDY